MIPIFGQTWLTTTAPLRRVTVLFTKFSKGQYGRSILEQLQSDENMKIKHIRLRFFIRLDLPMGYGGSRSLESFQFSSDGQPDMSPVCPLRSCGDVRENG